MDDELESILEHLQAAYDEMSRVQEEHGELPVPRSAYDKIGNLVDDLNAMHQELMTE